MFNNAVLNTNMVVDLKKYRIRIFKPALDQIGSPAYVQLLVNPQSMAVAVKSDTCRSIGNQTHKLSEANMKSDNYVELYSKAFVTKLASVVNDVSDGHSYRIAGRVLPEERMILFSLKEIVPLES